MSLNYKADLRKVGKKDLSVEMQNEVWGEINELTQGRLLDIQINPKSKEVTIRGNEEGINKQEVWGIKEYLKLARDYSKKTTRIAKIRERYGLEDTYQYEQLDELIMKKSRKIGYRLVDRGLENRLQTVKKILSRDKETGEVPIIRAGKNLMEQLEVKYEAYDNQDDYMRAADIDIEKYKTRTGKFRSKKAKSDYLKAFNKATDDQDFSWSDFAGYLFNNYIDSEQGETTRTYWRGLSKDEKIEIMSNFVEETTEFNAKVDTSEGTIRSFRQSIGGKKK